MPQTSISGQTTWCPVDEFLDRCDENTVGQLVSDDKKQAPPGELRDEQTKPGRRVLAALQSASGLWESAVLLGKRYSIEDLAALDGNSRALMYDVIAAVARVKLMERRPDKKFQLPPSFDYALQMLDLLRAGERILSLQQTAAAGVMEHREITYQEERARRGGFGDTVTQAERFFGVRH